MPNLYTGFYQELQTLQETYEDADFGFLENELLGNNTNAYDYLHGFCDIFANSLHSIFQYDVYKIYDENDSLVHAYCTTTHPKYGTIFIDVRGCTNDFQTFISEFEDFITITEDEPLNISRVNPTPDTSESENAILRFIQEYKTYYDI